MTTPLVIGHRGAPAYRPEHSRSSFLLAIEQGAQAIEVDVVPTADGVLAVRHERALGGTTDVADRPEFASRMRRARGGRPEWCADDFTADELTSLRCRERLPAVRPGSAQHDDRDPVLLLAEVLELAAAADVLLVVEVKDWTRCSAMGLDPVPMLVAELAAAPRLPRLAFESFEKTPLRTLAALGHPVLYLLEAVGMAADERERADGGSTYRAELLAGDFPGCAGVSLPVSLLTHARVDALHARGLQVWTWTLRAEDAFLPSAFRSGRGAAAYGDWRSCWNIVLDAGVDAVFTDQPDLAVGLIAARAGGIRRPALAHHGASR